MVALTRAQKKLSFSKTTKFNGVISVCVCLTVNLFLKIKFNAICV